YCRQSHPLPASKQWTRRGLAGPCLRNSCSSGVGDRACLCPRKAWLASSFSAVSSCSVPRCCYHASSAAVFFPRPGVPPLLPPRRRYRCCQHSGFLVIDPRLSPPTLDLSPPAPPPPPCPRC
ncbi:unnamed protein product, partial [Ectocarpus sp. 8 AP-2014]